MVFKWFATITCGEGVEAWLLFEDCTKEKAERLARQECINLAKNIITNKTKFIS
jgi:hypothetical protein